MPRRNGCFSCFSVHAVSESRPVALNTPTATIASRTEPAKPTCSETRVSAVPAPANKAASVPVSNSHPAPSQEKAAVSTSRDSAAQALATLAAAPAAAPAAAAAASLPEHPKTRSLASSSAPSTRRLTSSRLVSATSTRMMTSTRPAVSPPSPRTVSATSTAPPLEGLSLAGFREFIALVGGRSVLENKTTGQVKAIVLEKTRATSSAAVSLLSPANVARANKFLSHVYGAPFLDAFDAAEAWEARQPPGKYYYYFDLLVVNQHGQGAIVPFEVLRDTFASGVLGAGCTLLILDETASAATRLWCVFEIVTTLMHNVPLEVIMAPRHGVAFREQLVNDYASVINRTMSVDVEKATAYMPEDEKNIRSLIVSGSGYLKANQLIVGAMQEWMLSQGRTALAAMGEEDRGLSHLSMCMALLLEDLGKLREAEILFREILADRRRVWGDDHDDTLDCMNNMGNLMRALGNLSEAEALLQEVLTSRRRILGSSHPDTIASIANVALVLHAMGNLAEAEVLQREALVSSREVLGDRHQDTLSCINCMATLMHETGNLPEAEELYREALVGSQEVLGDSHPDTLYSLDSLASVLHEKGDLHESELLFRQALALRRRVLGDSNPDTLISINSMALLLQAQGNLGEAEVLFREALTARRAVLGDDHPQTQISIQNLAALLQAQGKLPEAELLLQEVNARESELVSIKEVDLEV